MPILIPIKAYIRAAQEVVDSYPPDIRKSLFRDAAIELRLNEWENKIVMDSTGNFWSCLTPYLYRNTNLPIHNDTVPDGGDIEGFNRCFPVIEDWKQALRLAITQLIADKLK